MLTVHHLQISQSERIVWLCEELNIPYELVTHVRAPLAAPESLKSLPGNELGRAPFIVDSDANVTLAESGAVCQYIIRKFGEGRLNVEPSEKNFADYLYWFHYANADLQATMMCYMTLVFGDLPKDSMLVQFTDGRVASTLGVMDKRLGSCKWLAGDEFTAADIMCLFSVTTARHFVKLSLSPYPGILRWIKDCASRPAYQRAMEKGDPDMELLLGPEAVETTLIKAGGTTSDVWKKQKGGKL